jgi:homoserine kinase type II
MLTTTDIAQVLSHYDLGTLYSITHANRGYVNETAFVQTATDRLVVRRNSRRQSEVAQRYRHQLMMRLYEQGFPTPTLLPTHDGETLLTINGRTFEVLSFVKGEDFTADRPQQLTSMGATLGRYHHVVKDMPPPPDTDAADRRYSPQGVLALTEMLLRRDIMGDLAPMLSWYDEQASRLRIALPNKVYDALPHLVIHGDVHRDNFLFARDEVVAMLDYDQIAWDTPVTDLADALIAFASVDKPHVLNWGVFNGPLDEARAENIIEGYAQSYRLSPTEIAILPVMIEVAWLHGELSRVVSTPEADPDYHLAVLSQGQQLSQWMNTHREDLIAHWTGIATGLTSSRIMAPAA